MTTETTTDSTPKTDNKSTFAPLGKYAAIAVIMVSIIVTTAIMLDKQLNSVERELAAIESEVASLHNTETAAVVESDPETKTEQVAMAAVEPEVNATQELPANTQDINPTVAVEKTAANTQDTTTTATVEKTAANTQDTTTTVAVENTPSNDTQVSAVQNENEQKTNDRIVAYKLEQKSRMADMYARIKALESKQLEQYKSNQDKQVAQLRARVSQQGHLIEELIARNKEWFELRTANAQRNQARREDILNRI